MRWRLVSLVVGIGAVSLVSLVVPVQEKLIWNRSDSAPIGLYWIKHKPAEIGDWVVVSAGSDVAVWAQEQGFVGKDWPLIKQVAAVGGDRICRRGVHVIINGEVVAEALEHDQAGRNLPVWSGCRIVKWDEIFLLNDHPRSLDGRYFGPLKTRDLDGVALLIMEAST